MRAVLACCLALPLLAQAPAPVKAPAKPPAVAYTPEGRLPDAVEVMPGLFVAGIPTPALLGKLKELGIRAVLNLRQDDEGDFSPEQKLVEKSGIHYARCPTGRDPDARTLDAFRKAYRALPRDKGPVLVHCATGNRTAGALYTAWVLDEHMPADKALALARKAGLDNPITEAASKAYVDARQKAGGP